MIKIRKAISAAAFLAVFAGFCINLRADISVRPVLGFDLKVNQSKRIEFSPKGRYFYALDDAGTLSVWDSGAGRLLYSRTGKERDDVSFSPDDRLVLRTGKNESHIINAETGQLVASVSQKIDEPWTITWTARGDQFAAQIGRFTVGVFDSQTGKLKHSFVLRNWKRKKLAIQRFLDVDTSSLKLKFTPDGRRLLTATGLDDAKLWDVDSGKVLFTFTQKLSSDSKGSKPLPVTVTQISPDGKWIMTASTRDVRLWDAASGRQMREFDSYERPGFSPDNRYLGMIYGPYSTTEVCDLVTLRTLTLDSKYAGAVAVWSPDGRTVLTDRTTDEVSKNEVYMWDVATGKQLWSAKTYSNRCFDLVSTCISDSDRFEFNPNGAVILSSNNKQVKILSPRTGDILATVPDALGPASWSRDGKYILARKSRSEGVGIWEVFEK